MNSPYGITITTSEEEFVDPNLHPAHCHDPECPGHDRGWLYFEETELCPFKGCEEWS